MGKLFANHAAGAIVISTVIVLGFAALAIGVSLGKTAETTTVTTILTLFGSKFSTVADYWLGASSLSAKPAPGAQPPQA